MDIEAKIKEIKKIPDAIKDINLTPNLLSELNDDNANALYSDELMENAGRALMNDAKYDYKRLLVLNSWDSKAVSDYVDEYKFVFVKNSTYWYMVFIKKAGQQLEYSCNNRNMERVPNEEDWRTEHTRPLFGGCGYYALVSLYETLRRQSFATIREKTINLVQIDNDPSAFVKIRAELLDSLKQQMKSTIQQKIYFISENEQFLTDYKQLIDYTLKLDKMNKINNEYRQMLSDKNDDQSKLQELKVQLLSLSDVKETFLQTNKNSEILRMNIQEKYQKETNCMSTVFSIINGCAEPQKTTHLKDLCTKLSFDFDKIQTFVKPIPEKSAPTKPDTEKTVPAYSIPPHPNIAADKNIKSIADLIKEFQECHINAGHKLVNNKELMFKYEKYTSFWKSWMNKSLDDIETWVHHCHNSDKDANLSFYEGIAVVNRAFEFCVGHELRLPQILALILMHKKDPASGLLCQIQTGEGKTFIITAIVILKILLDKVQYIDIITSNSVLAKQAVTVSSKMYRMFHITVGLNTDISVGQKDCYAANVVYGSMSDFQFDYLNHDFNMHRTRVVCNDTDRERQFEYVIIDEVDNMLIDNGGNIAKLAETFSGMESLIYIYIDIWKDLNEFFLKVFENTPPSSELVANKIEEWKEQIKNGDKYNRIINNQLISKHLTEYVKEMYPKWIDNAIYAKYECSENIHYVIQDKLVEKDEDDAEMTERVIVPVDFTNTGVTLKNTMWSHGLHQFIQLKHNLQVQVESLTSCCISNYAYILKYGSNLIGLTGTIGGDAEQRLLRKIYNVQFVSLPTFKVKDFAMLAEVIVADVEWIDKVIEQCVFMMLEGRAVLVVCLTIADSNEIYDRLEALKSSNQCHAICDAKFKKYQNEDQSAVTDETIDCGTIIIATNIAGRGTDFRTTAQLEHNGGLHICVTFCPENQRVKDQVFYRTSRQGNKGTAGLILCQSQILAIMKDDGDYKYSEVSEKLLANEQTYMAYLSEIKSKDLYFDDCLFSLFSNLYKKCAKDKLNVFCKKDLKEFWAFWFEKQQLDDHKLDQEEIKREAAKQFEHFTSNEKTQGILEGNVRHNPYYNIHRAYHYLSFPNLAKAKQCFESNAIDSSLCEAHYCRFEIAMESGGVLMNKVKELLQKFGIGYILSLNKDVTYKTQAQYHLKTAKDLLQHEIDVISTYFQNSDFQIIFDSSNKDNYFIKHLQSKLICLQIFHDNMQQVWSTIEASGAQQDLTITFKNEDFANRLESDPEDVQAIKQLITSVEVKSLQSRGLRCLYTVDGIQEIPKGIVCSSSLQIVTGFGILGLSSVFPICFPFAADIAATFIAEGIIDIIICLIGGRICFDWNYIKGKVINYGVSMIALALKAFSGFINRLISKARNMLKIDEFLQLAKFIPGVEYISNTIANVNNTLSHLMESFQAIGNVMQIPKPLLNTLWITTQKVGRFAIISNMIDCNFQNKFLNIWNRVYTTITQLVDSEFIGKLNADVLTTLYCAEGYRVLMDKLSNCSLINPDDLQQIAGAIIIHTDMWEILGIIGGAVNFIVEKCKPFLQQLVNEISTAIRSMCNVKESGDDVLENKYSEEQIRIQVTDQIFNNIQSKTNNQLFAGIRKRALKHSQTEDADECKRILDASDPYAILNVDKGANETVIHEAYSRLSCKYSSNSENERDREVFNKINNAFNQIKKE